MKRLSKAVLLLCLCFLVSTAAYSGDKPEEITMKITAVAAFKNGLGFIVKQGAIRLESGVGRITPLPSATLGSLWVASNDSGTSIDELVAYRYKSSNQQSLTTIPDVLLANTGKVVTVIDNSQKEYTGEVVGFRPVEPVAPEPPAIVPMNPYARSISVAPIPRPATPEFLLLKADGNLVALRFGNIQRVVLPKDPVLEGAYEQERRALRIKMKGAIHHANLTMAYLEHGIGWSPSYLLTLQDDKTAQITMQSVLINDAEDFNNADVFFVVGVPNFAYSNIPSPMALQQSLYEFMQTAARRDGVGGGLTSNAIIAQQTYSERLAMSSPDFGAGMGDMSGAAQEDLFLYTRPGVTLARGERGTFNVFSSTVACEHVYEWTVEDDPRVDAFGNVQNLNRAPSDEDRNLKNNVWHSLRLKNVTNFPWTSAPTMVVQDMKPVAQDILPYTPKGAASTLKLTVATDIRSSHEEREVARQHSDDHRRGYNYELVSIEGTLKLKNYKGKEVHLLVNKTMRGTVESQTDNGTVEKLAEAISVDNPMSRATWDLTLKPGEARTITYRYKIWVRV